MLARPGRAFAQYMQITSSAGANGSISPSGSNHDQYGTNVTFTASPNSGYMVNNWQLDSNVVQTGGTTYSLNDITASHTVYVTFTTLPTYTITPSAGANGSISPNTQQNVTCRGQYHLYRRSEYRICGEQLDSR